MVRHIVMWRLHENNKENLYEISRLLLRLSGLIDDLESLKVGSNFNPSEFAFDLALITTHPDKAALARCQKHSEHIVVTNRIKELTKEKAVVDFEY